MRLRAGSSVAISCIAVVPASAKTGNRARAVEARVTTSEHMTMSIKNRTRRTSSGPGQSLLRRPGQSLFSPFATRAEIRPSKGSRRSDPSYVSKSTCACVDLSSSIRIMELNEIEAGLARPQERREVNLAFSDPYRHQDTHLFWLKVMDAKRNAWRLSCEFG
jgi:hypothetical protein